MDDSVRLWLFSCAVRGPLAAAELRAWAWLVLRANEGGLVDVPVIDLVDGLCMPDRSVRRALAGCVAFRMLYNSSIHGRISGRIEIDPDQWAWANGQKWPDQLSKRPKMAGSAIETAKNDHQEELSKGLESPGRCGDAPSACAAKTTSTSEFTPRDNINNSKKSKKKPIQRTPQEMYLAVSKAYHERIRMLYPKMTGQMSESTDVKGALVLEDLCRLDGHAWEDVKAVLRWALTDSFWSRNLVSLASARDRGRNGQTKYLNCALKRDEAMAMINRSMSPAHERVLAPREQVGEVDYSGMMAG